MDNVIELNSEDSCFVYSPLELFEQAKEKYLAGNTIAFFQLANQCIDDLKNVYDQEYTELNIMLAKCKFLKGEHLDAIDHYVDTISFFVNKQRPDFIWYLYIDVAEVYLAIEQIEIAESYLDKAKRYLEIHPETKQCQDYLFRIYFDYGRVHLNHDFDKAIYCFRKMESCLNTHNMKQQLIFYAFKYTLYRHHEDLTTTMSLLLQDDYDYITIVMDLDHFLSVLLIQEKYEQFLTIYHMFSNKILASNFIFIKQQLLDLKIQCDKMSGDQDVYFQDCALYYELMQENKQNNALLLLNAVKMRQTISSIETSNYNMRKENIRLLNKSTKDDLTRLNNRAHFNEMSEKLFEEAKNTQNTFAIEMVDIDYFKQYNDNYGHQAGDECIKQVAALLLALEGTNPEHITAFRYGGDEFAVIYIGLDEKDVQDCIVHLRNEIHKTALKHEFSKAANIVTISQGCCWDHPKTSDSLTKYIEKADNNLYTIKKESKDALYQTRYRHSLFNK